MPLGEQSRAIQEVVRLALPAASETRVDGALIGGPQQSDRPAPAGPAAVSSLAGEESRREIDPYGLVYLMQRWYLVGYCHLRDDLRMFRLDRIAHCRTLETTFAPPHGFDCLEFATRSIASMPGHWPVSVRLDLPLEAARERIPATHGTLAADGRSTIYRCTVDDLDSMARYLVGLGCRFTVLEPDDLAFQAALSRPPDRAIRRWPGGG
ncbi:MAG: WYL domain-containing protein [Thermomicrobiales bacterium]